ncbi:MAG: alpha-ketoacid dehydrogenase subunit beta [bacterium (Candidatus Ratteibacteria) CG_4_10_14_3_um_filter_41_18]|uniref:Alpha-ketoacid dehydrogenase subunit beta n=4 Tax=Candidatus Ratteibacteria TaxID=2979319 RepID=A0A2M7YF57_9BACT|nr:MAG: alpha-ketoacid dehydrogenase subunit beta [Candidatus Omnitrophica bacterium CG1_02_41_171]PIV64176.1 MAG: alpha-ketoacid dehydrogenase subunit beta [bacterium (Candidatus Ratteibacteria) CG01_land_8_20_14_3_00_40_19]PIW33721.1 MAG: alpha-ketoacid dehydrogenase subunit beta [bacterium (Candidatus Ratteibacteria) CG15_BIG_FIL_POST_REV_8_21_14_020_41_12]PIW73750.1 MAG: alpha-ketoacid dehydrogenase subunit beta [bacterium (Candidatus Ratteibacteria) CG_4_8_14_3_um_filter_41_36]PIX76922.1 M
MREITYRQALNEALVEEMERDERVFLMGEDVGPYGGAYGVSKGLIEKFGEERVRDTAISEAAIIGAGLGAAMTGMRPIVEIMYIDFIGICMGQINNQVAKVRYMFGGKTKVPLVIRTEGGTGRTLGAHHSQSLESWFIHIPGIKVVMPATPYDAKGLLKTSIRDDNPILFIEHKMLYNRKGEVPESEYLVPVGEAEVKREGSGVTLITYSQMLFYCLEAAEELEKQGISVEIIDLRTLLPLDIQTIVESVKKTNRAIIVEEDCKTGGTGAEIGMQIMENAFDHLDAPIKRVAGADVPMPKSPNLEKLAIPSKEDIIKAVKEILGK